MSDIRLPVMIIVPPLRALKVVKGSSKRGDLLNHKSEEQIRSLDEPEAETLIGRRKKRKRRTVKEENPPDSDSHPIKTLAKTASDLNYSCKIDKVSEAEIVDAVQSINYSIDNLIANILAGVKESKLSYHKLPPPKTRKPRDIPSYPDLDIPILHILLMDSPSPLSDDMRDYVVELILHNLVSSLIHKHYFEGVHFFGVGSDSLYEHLETMFSKLVEGENPDLTAIQRWRSMSVEAMFQMNNGVESQLYEELISHLERILKDAYPLSPSSKKVKPISFIVHGEEKSLLDVIRQARNLSFMIQQVVSCQILVTIALSTQTSPDEDIIGTYSFGLQKNLGPDRRTILMRTKIIPSAVLRSHTED